MCYPSASKSSVIFNAYDNHLNSVPKLHPFEACRDNSLVAATLRVKFYASYLLPYCELCLLHYILLPYCELYLTVNYTCYKRCVPTSSPTPCVIVIESAYVIIFIVQCSLKRHHIRQLLAFISFINSIIK